MRFDENKADFIIGNEKYCRPVISIESNQNDYPSFILQT